MIPASMGLRFQVPADLESFAVTASWGTYETVETDKVSKAGRPIRHYQRTPVEERRTVRLADLDAGRTIDGDACVIDLSSCRSVRRSAVWAGAGGDRAVQRPRDAHAHPGEHVDVPDQAARRCRRRRGVPAGPRCPGAGLARARRGGQAPEPPVPQPTGVRDRSHLLGGLGGQGRARVARPRWRRPGCLSGRRRRRGLAP